MNTRERAAQASIILTNEVFQELLSNMENSIIQEWKLADSFDIRESCWLRLDALRSITEDLNALVQNDKIENPEIHKEG
jgi:hypothetical protein|tara:strand:- start:4810 stop:5046 length:237 start_codon:yes stop_codon:yes gene_type:complete